MDGVDKLSHNLAGMTVLERSFAMFRECDDVCCVAVVANESNTDEVARIIESARKSDCPKVVYATGGRRRQDSVMNGINALRASECVAEFVAIHDGARPLAESELLRRGLRLAQEVGAAVPTLPLTDSVKRVKHGMVVATVDRAALQVTQTPQVFRMDVLSAAHESVEQDVTDDAAIVELAGGLVATFPGEPTNIKLTVPSDLTVANGLLGAETAREVRTGVGYDVHKLVAPGPLMLGGVEIEFGMHLEGHSDGDVLMHAVASAVLGAAQLGDMGSNFPSSDPRFADANSAYFVRQSTDLARREGWRIEYIDAVVIAARPRMAPHYDKMVLHIAEAAGVSAAKVNVKSTTTDGVGGIGAGEGIGAQAVVTVTRDRSTGNA